MSPKSVTAIERIPVVLVWETNCRTHRPRTKMIKKLVSKSFTRAGESCVPRCPVRFRNVPIISNTPPINPHHLKQAMPRFSARP